MKKYLYLILFFLVCVPAIAGTINSYTLKSPPDDADTIVIYDSDDGSTKKIQVGDISGSGSDVNWTDIPASVINTENINWTSIDNQEIRSEGINWSDIPYTEIIYNGSTTPLKISSSPSGDGDLFVISSAGNVGIGTPSAISRLRVFSPSTNVATFLSTASSASSGTGILNIGTNDGAALSTGDSYAEIRFLGTFDTSGSTGVASSIKAGAVSGWSGSNRNSSLTFETVDSGDTFSAVRMAMVGANIGIGTQNPQATVEIIKQSTTVPFMVSSTAGGLGDYFRVSNGGRVGIGTTSCLGGACFMNGNVGIGTANPTKKLELIGGGLKSDDFYSGDGTQGITSSCGGTSVTSITIKDGLITACSGT